MTKSKLLEVRITEPEVVDGLFDHPARYRFTLFFQDWKGLTWEVGTKAFYQLSKDDRSFQTGRGFEAEIIREVENTESNIFRKDRFEII